MTKSVGCNESYHAQVSGLPHLYRSTVTAGTPIRGELRPAQHSPPGPQTGVFAHPTDAGFSSFGEAANKYGSQPANPFVVRPGQFHIALCVLEGLVAQPLL